MSTLCNATTKAGTPCPNPVIPGQALCFSHSPKLADVRHRGRVRGGVGKRNENRAMKRLPGTIRDTLEVLYRTLHGLESGEIEPVRATAIAGVTRAIVSAFDAGQVEARIMDLESRMEAQERPALTTVPTEPERRRA